MTVARCVYFLVFAALVAACSDPSSVEDRSVADAVEDRTFTRPLRLTSPTDTPPVDPSTATVATEDILFDTFDGGFVSLADAEPELVDRLLDAIRPIDAPTYQSVSAADWLSDDDLVVGYVDPLGQPWAYAARILNSREIVNDELGGAKVAVTYCPLCGSGIVFSRELDGRELAFSNTSALYENDMVMVDRETGSYWWQVAGEAVVGPLTGGRLEVLAAQTTTWASWRTQYPTTAVMARPDGQAFSGDSFANYRELLDSGRTPFPVSDGVLDDDRLSPATRVVVVTINGESRAWATEPARVVEDELGGESVMVETDGTGAAVTDGDGNPVPSRSLFWFSAVSVYGDIDLGE